MRLQPYFLFFHAAIPSTNAPKTAAAAAGSGIAVYMTYKALLSILNFAPHSSINVLAPKSATTKSIPVD